VRSRQDLIQPPPDGMRSPPYSPPPPPRPRFDSEPQHTRVKAPDPTLLALARGDAQSARAWSLAWFLCGALVGAMAVWSQTRDVAADVYRTRLWVASSLRALHDGREEAPVALSVPATAAAQVPVLAPVPVVDVSTLPRADRNPRSLGATAPAPTQPGAPALSHAPGPR
jgi:hypothetical protein